MKKFYVYRIEFSNGTFYIGYRGSKKEPEQDLLIHYNTSSKKVKLLIESGDLCTYSIVSSGMSKEDAYNLEQELIYKEFNDDLCLNDACYYGRIGFGIISEEAKQLISNSSTQMWKDAEIREKIIKSQQDSWTDERRYEQAYRLTGKKRPDHSEKLKGRSLPTNHPFFNAQKSEEHKLNISKSLKGKPKTSDHCLRLKEVKQNRTPEELQKTLENRRHNSKPKFEIDGISYVSLNQASEQLGVTPFFVKKLITRRL